MRSRPSDRFREGQFVRSRQGRDKDHLYVIVALDESFVYVADGTKWTARRPKKKNPLHLQYIGSPGLSGYEKIGDDDIVRALKACETGKED